jgi:hypothetical protein
LESGKVKVEERGDTRHFTTTTGRAMTGGPTTPWTSLPAESSSSSQITIAILERSPYGMDSVWSSWDDAMSDQARDATGVS